MPKNINDIKVMDWHFKTWLDMFLSSSVEEMSLETTGHFVKCMLLEKNFSEEEYIVPEQVKNDYGYKILKVHKERLGLNINHFSSIFILSICDTPTEIVMYLSALFGKSIESNIDQITIINLSEIFPWGFLTKESLRACWAAQKIKHDIKNEFKFTSDNYLDFVNVR